MPWSPEQRKIVIGQVNRMFDTQDGEVEMLSPVVEGPPDGQWKTYINPAQRYLVFRVGPPDAQIDNCIRALLGHEPITFKR